MAFIASLFHPTNCMLLLHKIQDWKRQWQLPLLSVVAHLYFWLVYSLFLLFCCCKSNNKYFTPNINALFLNKPYFRHTVLRILLQWNYMSNTWQQMLYWHAVSGKKIDNQHVNRIKGVENIFPELGFDESFFAIEHINHHKRKENH